MFRASSRMFELEMSSEKWAGSENPHHDFIDHFFDISEPKTDICQTFLNSRLA